MGLISQTEFYNSLLCFFFNKMKKLTRKLIKEVLSVSQVLLCDLEK